MSHIKTLDKLKEIVHDIYLICEYIQDSEEFRSQVDEDLKRYFYHLFIKCWRNFKAINILLESELENSYLEAYPLLRSLLEAYMHMCYLIKEAPNKEVLLENYEILFKSEISKMINVYSKVVADSKDDEKFIKSLSRNYTLPTEFKYIWKLAEITENSVLYESIYSASNKYVHFNPANLFEYGTLKDGEFTFGKYNRNIRGEGRLYYYSISIMILLIHKVAEYLEIEEVLLAKNEVRNFWKKWMKLRDKSVKLFLE
jgi:Family of unknown function (DUF5677)